MSGQDRRLIRWMVFAYVFASTGATLAGRTITVDPSDPAHFSTIQAAINDANDGDIVIIQPGTYTGRGNCWIGLKGKAITVQSADPCDPDVVASTVIDCQGTQEQPSCGFIFYQSGETSASVVAGLTIRNGYGGSLPDLIQPKGGGIFCCEASPTIRYCRIEDCTAELGGGVYLENSQSIISHCAILRNSRDEFTCKGGGIYCTDSNATITHCEIAENNGGQDSYGGGIYSTGDGTVRISNCYIHGNYAYWGGNAISGRARISNCTIINNWGGWGYGVSAISIVNSIVWNNGGWDHWDWDPDDPSQEIVPGVKVSYCDVKDGYPGEGNIDVDPLVTEDGHTRYDSFVYNAGDPNYTPLPGEADMDGEPRVMDGRIDIGADEFYRPPEPILQVPQEEFSVTTYSGTNPPDLKIQISNRGSGVLDWAIRSDASWLTPDPTSGSSSGETTEVTLSIDVSALSAGLYETEFAIESEGVINSPVLIPIHLHVMDQDRILCVPSEYPTIGSAIDVAVSGRDTVVVSDGLYTGAGNWQLGFQGKSITVRSENGPESCIIHCEDERYARRGLWFFENEDANAVVEGFTIRNATTGIHIGGCSPTIRNCIITNCESAEGAGVSVYGSDSLISDCVIVGNRASREGGGIMCEDSNLTVMRCTISGNTAYDPFPGSGTGGGIYGERGTLFLSQCRIEDNLAYGSGGGLAHEGNLTVNECIITGNTAGGYGGGLSVSKRVIGYFPQRPDGQSSGGRRRRNIRQCSPNQRLHHRRQLSGTWRCRVLQPIQRRPHHRLNRLGQHCLLCRLRNSPVRKRRPDHNSYQYTQSYRIILAG